MSLATRVVFLIFGVITAGVILLALLATFSRPAHARWKAAYADSPYASWYSSQRNAKGQFCCDKSDGHPYYGAYTINKDGSVTLDLGKGGLRQIPSYMVLTGANPTGHAVWWYLETGAGQIDYCFAPGTLS